MLWFYLTICASSLQAIRNLLQKSLKGKLDAISISWARVLFTLPVALFVASYLGVRYFDNLSNSFYIYAFLAGFFQLAGTVALVELFSYRNFVVGITYMKTEVLQTAILGAVLLGEGIGLPAMVAIILGTIGVVTLSPFHIEDISKLRRLFHKSAAIGLLSGFCYSVCALFMKKAMILTNIDSQIYAVLLTLVVINIFQNIMIVVYKLFQKRLLSDTALVFREWKKCASISYLGMFVTFCWMFAFILTSLANVKIVGQFEVLLSFIIAHRFFKERVTKYELVGILLLCGSIVTIVIF